MKGFVFWVLLSVAGSALVVLSFATDGSFSSVPDMDLTRHEDDTAITTRGRELKEVKVEDYEPIDPVPSSKASIQPGPIQHATPLMPYIPNPKPSPPDHPTKPAGFP